MNTAIAVSAPRKATIPSPRNQQIYLDYQIAGCRQSDLAEKYGLTQCRISQIIRRVERWLRGTHDQNRNATDNAARQSLERRLQRDRLNAVARQAMRHFQEPQKTVTHKTGARADKSIDETTERTLPPNLQCLKVVLQANAQLTRLEEKTSEEQSQQLTSDERRKEVEAWLAERRQEAETSETVPRSGDADFLVHDLVSALLGEKNRGFALHNLARQSGQKIVARKSYDGSPARLPPQDGYWYPMYDAHGTMVAWIPEHVLAGAMPADFPPVSRNADAPASDTTDGSASEPPAPPPTSLVASSDQSSPQGEVPESIHHSPCSPSSSTTLPPASSSQAPSSPALTPLSAETNFFAPNTTLPLPVTIPGPV